MKKVFLFLAITFPISAMAGADTDIINGARMSIQVESRVQTVIAKCNIQEGNSHISFGMPCATNLNNANSVLFNFPDREESVKLRKQIVNYANGHNIQLDQRFISDL